MPRCCCTVTLSEMDWGGFDGSSAESQATSAGLKDAFVTSIHSIQHDRYKIPQEATAHVPPLLRKRQPHQTRSRAAFHFIFASLFRRLVCLRLRKVKTYPTIDMVTGCSALRCKLSGRHPRLPPTMRRHFPSTALIDLGRPAVFL